MWHPIDPISQALFSPSCFPSAAHASSPASAPSIQDPHVLQIQRYILICHPVHPGRALRGHSDLIIADSPLPVSHCNPIPNPSRQSSTDPPSPWGCRSLHQWPTPSLTPSLGGVRRYYEKADYWPVTYLANTCQLLIYHSFHASRAVMPASPTAVASLISE